MGRGGGSASGRTGFRSFFVFLFWLFAWEWAGPLRGVFEHFNPAHVGGGLVFSLGIVEPGSSFCGGGFFAGWGAFVGVGVG